MVDKDGNYELVLTFLEQLKKSHGRRIPSCYKLTCHSSCLCTLSERWTCEQTGLELETLYFTFIGTFPWIVVPEKFVKWGFN